MGELHQEGQGVRVTATVRDERNAEAVLVSQIQARIASLLERSGLFARFEPKFPAAVTWVLTCSPEGASVEQLSMATMDLHLWFLYLDDYAEADYADLYRQVSKVVDGDHGVITPDDSERSRVLRQFAEHTSQLATIGLPIRRYVEERKVALATYERRNLNRETATFPTFDEFLRIREVTTLFRLWYTLWEILAGFQLTDEEYASPIFDRAIRATSRWHVFINDLHSLRRDIREGTPNLILCLERERGMSTREAVTHLMEGSDELVREIEEAWQEARGLGLDVANMRRAFQFLTMTIAGGRELYRRDLERYETPAGV